MLPYIGVIGQDSASNNKKMVRTLESLAQSVPGAKFKSAQRQVVYCLAHKINCATNRFFQAIDSSITNGAPAKIPMPSIEIIVVDEEGSADRIEAGDTDEDEAEPDACEDAEAADEQIVVDE